MRIFPHRDVDMWGHVWMSRFRRAWSSLNFYKEYLWDWDFNLCNFTDLIYAQTACNTPKTKENMKSHHMIPLKHNNRPQTPLHVITPIGASEGLGIVDVRQLISVVMMSCPGSSKAISYMAVYISGKKWKCLFDHEDFFASHTLRGSPGISHLTLSGFPHSHFHNQLGKKSSQMEG